MSLIRNNRVENIEGKNAVGIETSSDSTVVEGNYISNIISIDDTETKSTNVLFIAAVTGFAIGFIVGKLDRLICD